MKNIALFILNSKGRAGLAARAYENSAGAINNIALLFFIMLSLFVKWIG
ncbi:hypothetical protein RNA77_000304 [Salmonella enterica]|nr:hypothetical protein [Salmonella enterica]ELL7690673.1 hypothetical protein [Salmonella enterica]